MLYGEPGPNDIKQGRCGDCYFLASLSALAEFPDRIKRIFLTKDVNEAGCYAVQMYINGEKRTIVVDDYFPYDPRPEKDCWFFSRDTTENEIWVQILEKAYAKMFGSYEIVEGGKPYQALCNLTGFPSDVLYHDEINGNNLWKMISNGSKRD